MASPSPRGGAHGQVVAQFLEAVIHSILFHRNVYPPTSFELAQLYGMAVHYNRHPQVAEYVKEVADRATRGDYALSEVRVLIYEDEGIDGRQGSQKREEDREGRGHQEMYRLAFSPSPPQDDLDQRATSERDADKWRWRRMYDGFKATLLRLEVLSRHTSYRLPSTPDSLSRRTFCVQLLTKQRLQNEPENDWMIIERPVTSSGPHAATPIHTVRLADSRCSIEIMF